MKAFYHDYRFWDILYSDMVSVIAAVAKNGVIGRAGRIPWDLPEDRVFFRTITWGKTVVMGRRTFDSIGRVLPGRRNIILTRRTGLQIPGAETAPDIDSACALFDGRPGEVFVIGGGEIYRLFLPRADRIYLTSIDKNYEGDIYFPQLDMAEWREVSSRQVPGTDPRPGYVFRALQRRDHPLDSPDQFLHI